MSPHLFGTDGIRARFGDEPLTAATVPGIGFELARLLGETAASPSVLIAGDTRASTPTLSRWFAGGLAAAGARPVDLGTLPTGAIARLVPRLGAAAGVVISASHNPAEDNGIKLIDAAGYKWSREAEEELETRIAAASTGGPIASAAIDSVSGTLQQYLAILAAEIVDRSALHGLRIALDFANGAATTCGELFSNLGATIETFADHPDGNNINRECGATHPEALAGVLESGRFDLGFAFDGDADRAILLDERGGIHDGDAMLYLWARDLASRGQLPDNSVVATSMSNLGLERALGAHRIKIVRCDVGDRAVVETLRARGLRLGGEQSGHLVDLARSTTGDGLLTALLLADLVARAGRPVTELLAGFQRFPQILLNVHVSSKPELLSLPNVASAARRVESTLGNEGRLVLRYSGTESMARVMIEGPDEASIGALAGELAAAIRAEIGTG